MRPGLSRRSRRPCPGERRPPGFRAGAQCRQGGAATPAGCSPCGSFPVRRRSPGRGVLRAWRGDQPGHRHPPDAQVHERPGMGGQPAGAHRGLHRCRGCGARRVVARLVQESVVMLYADGGDTWLDEDAPVDRYPMAEGNHADEANTRRFTNGGGDGGDPALRLVLRARRCPQRADAHPSPPPHHHDPRRPSPGPTDTSQAKAQGRTGHQG